MGDEGLPPIFRLIVDTDRPVRALHAAPIFERLPSALNHFLSANGKTKVDLRLTKLHTGSLVADFLVVAAGVVMTWEFREALAGFMRDLQLVYTKLRNASSAREVESPHERLIDSLAAPVLRDNASQVSLNLYGDNNLILIIDSVGAMELQKNKRWRKRNPFKTLRRRPAIDKPQAVVRSSELLRTSYDTTGKMRGGVEVRLDLADGHSVTTRVLKEVALLALGCKEISDEEFRQWTWDNVSKLARLVEAKIGVNRPPELTIEADDWVL